MIQVINKPTFSKTLEDTISILTTMAGFPNFIENYRKLDVDQLVVFALSLTLHEFEPYEAVCRIGEAPTEVFYVLTGKIGVTNLNNKILTAEIIGDKIFHSEGKWSTLGEASILFNSNR